MAQITLKGNPIHTSDEPPEEGSVAPAFRLVDSSLAEKTLDDYSGKKVLNVFPSLDTPVCSQSVREFNQRATDRDGVTVLNISADLPFAHQRFCATHGLDNAVMLSCFRSHFPLDYGLKIIDGPLEGLCSRVVLVLDEKNRVVHREQVPEIAQEPDYDAALAAL